MTKLTQAMIDRAEKAFNKDPARYNSYDDEALQALIDAANEQLGQQAAAPGVEQVERVARAIAKQRLGSDKGWKLLIDQAKAAITALAVAPPPQPDLEDVAQWMIARSYATGHGDTIADLLAELVEQVRERAVAPPPVGLDLTRKLLYLFQDIGQMHSVDVPSGKDPWKHFYERSQESAREGQKLIKDAALSTPPVRGGK